MNTNINRAGDSKRKIQANLISKKTEIVNEK